jgi:hypothetical protein
VHAAQPLRPSFSPSIIGQPCILDGIVTVTPGLAGVAGAGEAGGMKPPPDPHYRHRFPAEVISHAVWLYRERNRDPTSSAGRDIMPGYRSTPDVGEHGGNLINFVATVRRWPPD